ncbi:MAG TPA: hypothetical protein VNK95_06155, partial [Caldilineaceae bacterium]|nr:hypothetical protein [Caldilineaceae bacterium]
ACRQFERTRWIAIVLADMHEIEATEQEEAARSQTSPVTEPVAVHRAGGEPEPRATRAPHAAQIRADVQAEDRVSTGGQS